MMWYTCPGPFRPPAHLWLGTHFGRCWLGAPSVRSAWLAQPPCNLPKAKVDCSQPPGVSHFYTYSYAPVYPVCLGAQHPAIKLQGLIQNKPPFLGYCSFCSEGWGRAPDQAWAGNWHLPPWRWKQPSPLRLSISVPPIWPPSQTLLIRAKLSPLLPPTWGKTPVTADWDYGSERVSDAASPIRVKVAGSTAVVERHPLGRFRWTPEGCWG